MIVVECFWICLKFNFSLSLYTLAFSKFCFNIQRFCIHTSSECSFRCFVSTEGLVYSPLCFAVHFGSGCSSPSLSPLSSFSLLHSILLLLSIFFCVCARFVLVVSVSLRTNERTSEYQLTLTPAQQTHTHSHTVSMSVGPCVCVYLFFHA